jgi:hypothetical protein
MILLHITTFSDHVICIRSPEFFSENARAVCRLKSHQLAEPQLNWDSVNHLKAP